MAIHYSYPTTYDEIDQGILRASINPARRDFAALAAALGPLAR